MEKVVSVLELIDDYPSFKGMMMSELRKEAQGLYADLKKVHK
jgi:hypothetical protein